MAPETAIRGNYDNKVDIYSTGILLYELFENKRYVPNLPLKWYWTPKKIRKIIIEQMLCKNPKERSTALNILQQVSYL